MLLKKILFGLIILVLPLPSCGNWIGWDTEEGVKRFERCAVKKNFWKLCRFYDTQINLKYCGIAAAVVILNALPLKPPLTKNLGEWPLFTQTEFFENEEMRAFDRQALEENGFGLYDLKAVLEAFSLDVAAYEARRLSDESMRSFFISALLQEDVYILALYSRKALSQIGEGHWSPVACYDALSDSFLILDVAKFKYPPAWVSAQSLFCAMRTVCSLGGNRGFLIVKMKD